MMRQHTHLGVYAILCHQANVVLIHKARGPYTGLWDLPGGRIEFGEEPLDALRREVAEETGLQIQNAALVHVTAHRIPPHLPHGQAEEVHHIGIVYRIDLPDPLPLRQTGDGQDSNGARWFTWAELDELTLTPLARRSLRALSPPPGKMHET